MPIVLFGLSIEHGGSDLQNVPRWDLHVKRGKCVFGLWRWHLFANCGLVEMHDVSSGSVPGIILRVGSLQPLLRRNLQRIRGLELRFMPRRHHVGERSRLLWSKLPPGILFNRLVGTLFILRCRIISVDRYKLHKLFIRLILSHQVFLVLLAVPSGLLSAFRDTSMYDVPRGHISSGERSNELHFVRCR